MNLHPQYFLREFCSLLSHYTTVTLLKTLTKLMVPLYLVCLPDLVHLAHCAKTHSVSTGSKAFTLIVSAQISHSNNCLKTIEESSVNRHGNAVARSTVDREITHKNWEQGTFPVHCGLKAISRPQQDTPHSQRRVVAFSSTERCFIAAN